MKLCGRCKSRPRKSHWNSKWCGLCAKELMRRPKSNMTPLQISQAKALIGKMPASEIAKRVGVSPASLKRAFRGTRIAYYNKYVANPGLVRAVCDHYEEHGSAKTQEAFPGVKIRSIVDRYKGFAPRQIRWTDSQKIELAKMAGIVSHSAQARYFKRPRANAGSIKSAWTKNFKLPGGSIHGMSRFLAKEIVTSDCPYIKTMFWNQRKATGDCQRMLHLWVDMERHLKPGVPKFIRDAIKTMAKFQRWLLGQQPKRAIAQMIRARETS